ncbi:MAG: hypothetical protein K0R00_287 [Herbinix sp.]|nr:hypothetical protein [Herbinix sp.]
MLTKMDYMNIAKSILCESKITQDIMSKSLIILDRMQNKQFNKKVEYIEKPFINCTLPRIPLQITVCSYDKPSGMRAIKIILLDFDKQKMGYWVVQQPPVYEMEGLYRRYVPKHKSEYLRLKIPFIGLSKPHCVHFSKTGVLCATNGFFIIYIDTMNNYAYLGPDDFVKSAPWHYSKQGGLSPDGEKLYFVKWPLTDWVKRIDNINPTVRCTVGFTDLKTYTEHKLLEINYQEEIHEITCSPNEKHLVCGTFKQELLYPYPKIPFSLYKKAYQTSHKKGGIQTQDLVTIRLIDRSIWLTRIPYPTIGHFVFNPIDSEEFYLSAHNLFYHQLTTYINGRGYIVKLRIFDGHTDIVSVFEEDELYRVFQHDIFIYRNRTYIAVVSYSNILYIIDANTMQLYRKIPLGKKLIMDFTYGCYMSTDDPDICFTANASYDGRYIIVGSRNMFLAYDMEEDTLIPYMDSIPSKDGIGIGHTKSLNR